jgi:hypothetical protein
MREGRLALVTGATSGIGLAYADRLASMGYHLIITGRRMEVLNARAEEIRHRHRVSVSTLEAELTRDRDLEELERVLTRERPSFLVNNAGFGIRSYFVDTPRKTWEALVKVHVMAPLRLTQGALKYMLEGSGGTIVNVSSEAAFLPVMRNSVYSGAKAFLLRWTESVALEVMGTPIRIQALCPGMTRSDFHPRMGQEGASLSRSPLIRWITPQEVVDESIRALQSGKVICVPKASGKMRTTLMPLIPQRARHRCLRWFFRASSRGDNSCNSEN